MANSDYTLKGNGPLCSVGTLGGPVTENPLDIFILDYATSTMLAEPKVGMAFMVEKEICVIREIDGNKFKVSRGCADTIPEPHNGGVPMWFFEGAIGSDSTEYLTSDVLSVKVLMKTVTRTMGVGNSPPNELHMFGRYTRPYPPGQVFVDDKPFYKSTKMEPSNNILRVTWAHRDRIAQADQLIGHEIEDVGPESGQTYTLRVFNASDVQVWERTGITVNFQDFTMTDANEALGADPDAPADIPAYFTLHSVRDGFASWRHYRMDFVANAGAGFNKGIYSGAVKTGDAVTVGSVRKIRAAKPTVNTYTGLLNSDPAKNTADFFDEEFLGHVTANANMYNTNPGGGGVTPSMYSGLMAKAVQLIMGFGDTNIVYDFRYNRTHGITLGSDNKPWLVEISHARGFVAMPLPMYPSAFGSTAGAAAAALFGGLPTGEFFPQNAGSTPTGFTDAVTRGDVLQILPGAITGFSDYVAAARHGDHIGWAFSPTGRKAVNTATVVETERKGVMFDFSINLGNMDINHSPGTPVATVSVSCVRSGSGPLRRTTSYPFPVSFSMPNELVQPAYQTVSSMSSAWETPIYAYFDSDETPVILYLSYALYNATIEGPDPIPSMPIGGSRKTTITRAEYRVRSKYFVEPRAQNIVEDQVSYSFTAWIPDQNPIPPNPDPNAPSPQTPYVMAGTNYYEVTGFNSSKSIPGGAAIIPYGSREAIAYIEDRIADIRYDSHETWAGDGNFSHIEYKTVTPGTTYTKGDGEYTRVQTLNYSPPLSQPRNAKIKASNSTEMLLTTPEIYSQQLANESTELNKWRNPEASSRRFLTMHSVFGSQKQIQSTTNLEESILMDSQGSLINDEPDKSFLKYGFIGFTD